MLVITTCQKAVDVLMIYHNTLLFLQAIAFIYKVVFVGGSSLQILKKYVNF